MQRDEQIEQIKLLMQRVDSRTTVDAGGFRRNPTSVYTDPELAERELDALFDDHPQLIGMSGELPNAGSFLTIDDLASPILATRDPAGQFRAFVNSCRHRGTMVETRRRGTTARFTCPFHGWTYGGDGALVTLTRPDHFGASDQTDLGLVELPALEQHGLLWVHPQPNGTIDLDAMLGTTLSAELASWQFDDLVHLDDDTYEVACNWKLAMDSFGETYHFETLHKATLAPMFHGNVQGYDTYRRNHRMLLCRREIDDLRARPESEWDITTATRISYWLFPNVQLMPFAEGAYLLRAYPDRRDPGRHTTRITFLAHRDADHSGEVLAQAAHGFARTIRDEDYEMCASQQRSAAGGIVPEIIFGRNEPALHHVHSMLRDALDMPPLPLLESLA